MKVIFIRMKQCDKSIFVARTKCKVLHKVYPYRGNKILIFMTQNFQNNLGSGSEFGSGLKLGALCRRIAVFCSVKIFKIANICKRPH